METKNKCVRVSFSAILYGVLTVLVCAVPCGAYILVDGTYELATEVADYVEVTDTGILELEPGGYSSAGIYVNVGGTINIYGSHTWTAADAYVQIAPSANVTLFTDSADSIKWNDGSPQFDPDDPTKIIGDGSMGKLTWVYEDVTYHLNISTSSDISVEIVGGPSPTPIDIDIKPGSYPNTINLGSNGVVPVAILSSASFDATQVDADTVDLAGAGVAVRGKGNNTLAHEEDVNADGLMDLVVQVETENLEPGQFQDGYAVLNGQTLDAVAFTGSDEITIVPPE